MSQDAVDEPTESLLTVEHRMIVSIGNMGAMQNTLPLCPITPLPISGWPGTCT